jgi:hypothetical protein
VTVAEALIDLINPFCSRISIILLTLSGLCCLIPEALVTILYLLTGVLRAYTYRYSRIESIVYSEENLFRLLPEAMTLSYIILGTAQQNLSPEK